MSKPSIAIRPYQRSDDEAIARLNQRFHAAGTSHVQYTGALTGAVHVPGHRERLFVVADGDEIRGGAFLREVSVSIGANETSIGWVKLSDASFRWRTKLTFSPRVLIRDRMKSATVSASCASPPSSFDST